MRPTRAFLPLQIRDKSLSMFTVIPAPFLVGNGRVLAVFICLPGMLPLTNSPVYFLSNATLGGECIDGTLEKPFPSQQFVPSGGILRHLFHIGDFLH
jgi:hypothetical protein